MIWNIFKRGSVGGDDGLTLSATDIDGFMRIRDRGTQLLQLMREPDDLRNAERFVRSEFSLYHRRTGVREVDALCRKEILAVEQLPGLSRVFMFHGDGRVREAALRNLEGPLISPASAYALFWRLNDWAAQVRNAAQDALQRSMPMTPAIVIIPALRALLPYVASWGRWSHEGQQALDAMLMRQDVVQLLVEEIVTTRRAQLGLQFREICRNPGVDTHLERMLREARLPHIRAMALDVLLSRRAIWPTRERRQVWIDRSMGRYRYEQVFLKRDVTVTADPYALIVTGLKDRAAIVRKCAADGLIALRHDADIGPKLDEIVASLEDDPNAGVRERLDFFRRKRMEESAQIR